MTQTVLQGIPVLVNIAADCDNEAHHSLDAFDNFHQGHPEDRCSSIKYRLLRSRNHHSDICLPCPNAGDHQPLSLPSEKASCS